MACEQQCHGRTTQDNLFLVDNTAVITNLVVITNGVGPASTGFGPTFIPTNWFFFRGLQFSRGHLPARGLPPGLFDFNRTNVEYSAYSVIFSPFTRLVYELAGQDLQQHARPHGDHGVETS
jgi:hypothetical protein